MKNKWKEQKKKEQRKSKERKPNNKQKKTTTTTENTNNNKENNNNKINTYKERAKRKRQRIKYKQTTPIQTMSDKRSTKY